jgi:hypothetical protein
MAVTAQGAALTEAHRVAQAKNGALVAYIVAQLWLKSIRKDDIAGSSRTFIERLLPSLVQRRAYSATLARKYYTDFRKLEVAGSDDWRLPEFTSMNMEALETSLRVTGEIAVKKKLLAYPREEDGRINPSLIQAAIDEAATQISGAATRHVMNGGRDELQSALESDPIALGYIRVTDGDPCFFCAMLASRGPVYSDDSFDQSDPRFIGDGQHKVHDHDACTSEPVFSRETQWPGVAREAEEMWKKLSEDLGHVPTIAEWRDHWNSRGRESTD